MRVNRSMPRATVILELGYPDVSAAAEWLCKAFGFTVRLRIADHRIQLNVGDGAVVLIETALASDHAHAVMVRIENADSHHDHAKKSGAKVLRPPTDYPYGERQYTAEDLAGHRWTFSQSIADVAPDSWGGTPVNL